MFIFASLVNPGRPVPGTHTHMISDPDTRPVWDCHVGLPPDRSPQSTTTPGRAFGRQSDMAVPDMYSDFSSGLGILALAAC